MTLLVTIVINGLNWILLKLFASNSTSTRVASQSISCINLNGGGDILRPSFLVASLPFLLLLLLFPSLLKDLSAMGALKSWRFLFLGPGLRFFDVWVLHWLALGIGFSFWRPTTPKAVLICVTSIEAKPEVGLCFGVNGFFDHFFKAIKLLAALFHFDLHWRLEAFLQVLNHCTFFWGTV